MYGKILDYGQKFEIVFEGNELIFSSEKVLQSEGELTQNLFLPGYYFTYTLENILRNNRLEQKIVDDDLRIVFPLEQE